MKFFIQISCLISLVFAEPPVNDSYAAAVRSSHGHDSNSDFQRSLSQEYGVPSPGFGTRNSLSNEYGPPNPASSARLSQSYGPPSSRISQKYGTPKLRKSQHNVPRIAQEYGSPNSRSSPAQEYEIPNSRSKLAQEYGVPNARSGPTQEYGTPNSRSGPAQEYGAPNVRSGQTQNYSSRNSFTSRTPSPKYVAPESRTTSEEYGAQQKSSSLTRASQKQSQFRSSQHQTLSQDYGVPSARTNDISQSYGAPKNAFKSSPSKSLSQTHGVPKSSLSQALSTSYGVPSTDSYSQEFGSISQSYDAPSQRDLSDTYKVPSTRGPQEYSAPDRSADLKTNAVVSSYSSARASPSSTYGVPSARDTMPSDHYGVPEQYNAISHQGYGYAREALDEQNQEPANYGFAYKVSDYNTGSDFGHTESRLDNRAEGSYFVVLPDGTKQVVEYEADERGFKPRISVEPAEVKGSAGYDDNAADLIRSDDAPY